MISKNDFTDRLRERGLRITPQRLAVIDALVENCDRHPGAALIYQAAQKILRSISLSTVYATLKEFSEQGLIRSLEFDRLENRYDANPAEHLNLVCLRCGAIADYDLPAFPEHKDIMRNSGFVVTDTRMEYYGYCRDCLKKP